MSYLLDGASVLQSVFPQMCCVLPCVLPQVNNLTGQFHWLKQMLCFKWRSQREEVFQRSTLPCFTTTTHHLQWPANPAQPALLLHTQRNLHFKQLSLYFWWKLLSKQPGMLTIWKQASLVIDNSWIGHTAAHFSSSFFFFHGRNGYGSPIKSCNDQIVEGSNFIGSGGGNWYSHTVCGF